MSTKSVVSACGLAIAALSAPAMAESSGGTSGIFDTRYCEIITVQQRLLQLTLSVYNTNGLNDCPQDAWNAIDAEALAAELSLKQVNKNGPRHWTIDGIVGRGITTEGERATFGGIEMEKRATLEMKVFEGMVGEDFYTPTEVQRDTTFIFKAGNPVFELTSPEGDVYMMQSYAQIADATLTLAQLPGLGARLELPQGWTYSTRTLGDEYRLEATGIAHVLQDDLQNSYQRRPK